MSIGNTALDVFQAMVDTVQTQRGRGAMLNQFTEKFGESRGFEKHARLCLYTDSIASPSDTVERFIDLISVLSTRDQKQLASEIALIEAVDPPHKRLVNWPAKAQSARRRMVDFCKFSSIVAATHFSIKNLPK